jgi:hypothetical protein
MKGIVLWLLVGAVLAEARHLRPTEGGRRELKKEKKKGEPSPSVVPQEKGGGKDSKPKEKEKKKGETSVVPQEKGEGKDKPKGMGGGKDRPKEKGKGKEKNEKEDRNEKSKKSDKSKDSDEDSDEDSDDDSDEDSDEDPDVEDPAGPFTIPEWLLRPCAFLERQFNATLECTLDVLGPLLALGQIQYGIELVEPYCDDGVGEDQVCFSAGFSGGKCILV